MTRLRRVPDACYLSGVVVSATTRWDLVADALAEELRGMTDEDKLDQVGTLMASVEAMGWTEALQVGDAEIWMRWQAIRANATRKRRPARRT